MADIFVAPMNNVPCSKRVSSDSRSMEDTFVAPVKYMYASRLQLPVNRKLPYELNWYQQVIDGVPNLPFNKETLEFLKQASSTKQLAKLAPAVYRITREHLLDIIPTSQKSSIRSAEAHKKGYDQVLWTDSVHNEFIEESGTMNAMFFIENTLVTPMLSGTILDGVTRDSLLAIAREKGINVEERQISYEELIRAFEDGKRVEAFGAGTAAVVAPIEIIAIGHKEYKCYIEPDAVMYQLQKDLLNIRKGITADNHNWNYII